LSTAWGWSPVIPKSETISKSGIILLYQIMAALMRV